tara:strand:- start:52 stop:219 length:168 start_codon:yes stop_codon:yes gene_type:complete
MARRTIQWVNTPVLMEAILRYQENRLPKSMKLWIEKLLEINASPYSNNLQKVSSP